MPSSTNKFNTITKEQWLSQFLDRIDLNDLFQKMIETEKYRREIPDWNRPVVMYGIRKKHKCIKKQEIAVIIDLTPWQQRAITAETHWYKIIYKRPATDQEWKEMKMKNSTRRYWIWSYFIEKGWTTDRIISQIVHDDQNEYRVDVSDIIKAFENHYDRRITITHI